MRRWLSLAALLGAGVIGCGDARESSTDAAPAGAAAVQPAAEPARPRIVALGDSLTAGLGLPESESYPSLLQQNIDADGYDFEVVNAGVSGDTSAGGLRRLDWALEGDVKILILALGANDALRGLSVTEMRRNLEAIIQGAQERHVAVLVAGMQAPPNYGLEYTVQFRQVYRDLAREHDLAYVPFLLEGVAGQSAYNQSDGIHPNREGARLVAETIWRALKPMIDAAASS
jgi:acyl-CoA thioesterase I